MSEKRSIELLQIKVKKSKNALQQRREELHKVDRNKSPKELLKEELNV